MQIKAAQEVRDCQTEVFFGMNLRQLVFTGLAGASAVLCWFLLRDRLSMETISWLCILAALPFGAFGFVPGTNPPGPVPFPDPAPGRPVFPHGLYGKEASGIIHAGGKEGESPCF